MKISQSLLFAYAAAQGENRWGSTDYYSFNYGFGGKQDSGIAFGMTEDPEPNEMIGTGNPFPLGGSYGYNSASAHYSDNLHFNGLLCWMCDFRLDLATEAEGVTCDGTSCQNAYARCLKNGMLMRCRGEQRTCMFEERRRHGVVYSVCTGCKQTDACVAHWRRNQRFTLPFMNFGDMSLRNLPNNDTTTPYTSGNLADTTTNALGLDQLPHHRPIYIDDECSTYQETRSEAAWRKTAWDGTGGDETNLSGGSDGGAIGTNNEVYPMGWIPATLHGGGATARNTNGLPFSAYTGSAVSALQFTGHRVNMGLSYSKFAYDGANDLQLNAQLSQWESTCRWCCHARPDTVCNIAMKTINSSPFSTKCGNAHGTRRDTDVTVVNGPAGSPNNNVGIHYASDMESILELLKNEIQNTGTGATNVVSGQSAYWELLGMGDNSITVRVNNSRSSTGATDPVYNFSDAKNQCSLSNAQWDTSADAGDVGNNTANYPQGIHNKFRFFQPFNIAQSNADFYDGSNYHIGPRFWMQMFQRTPQYDLSAWYSTTDLKTPKFPSTGEGRNSAGMDKFAGRGNKSRWVAGNRDVMNGNSELQHFFQQQTDMVSQENRDFFDSRANDARTTYSNANMHLKRYDNSEFWNFD